MSRYLTFKKRVNVGDKIYIIVRKLPPIILSGGSEKENYIKRDMSEFCWYPEERVISYFEYGRIFDEEDMEIKDDIVMFYDLKDAQKYCDEKNNGGYNE